MAAADAILSIENRPNAAGAEDILEAEWNWLILKAWTVAEKLKGIQPTEYDREGFVRTLFDCALWMHNDAESAQSVLQAAMALGTAPKRVRAKSNGSVSV